MKNLASISIVLILFWSCVPENAKEDDECLALGISNGLTIKLTSQNPLPTHFEIALNNEILKSSECDEASAFNSSRLKMADDRKSMALNFYLSYSNEDYELYFNRDSASSPPQYDFADLTFYTRETCDSEPVEVTSLSGLEIKWLKRGPSGSSCASSSYQGYIESSIAE